MIRLILSDLDGTLLGSDGIVSGKNTESVREAMACGIMFGIATGRYRAGCRKIMEMLKVDERSICCAYDNGAHVVFEGEQIYDGSMSRRDLLEVVRFLRTQKCRPALYVGENWIVEGKDEFYDRICDFYDGCGLVMGFDEVLTSSNPAFLGPIKIAVRARQEDMDKVYEGMRTRFPDFEYYLSWSTILEMNRKGEGKAHALEVLSKAMGISAGDVMAIGDYDNDADMIRAAGLGVAMANASPAAKASADFITLSNDDDGVAHAIGRFCLRERPR